MNREEAAAVLDAIIFGVYPDDDITINKIGIEAVRFAITALRGPQPDPITGLMPCGCGRRVSIAFYPGWTGTFDLYQVDCFSCHVGTRPCQTAEQAKAAWNAAMGWRADE